MILEIIIVILLTLVILLTIILLHNRKNAVNNKSSDDFENLMLLHDSIERLKANQELMNASQRSSTQELSKNISELYTLFTKGRSGHQGCFGEVSLKMILESSGFVSGINFDEQVQIGHEKPDFVIHLPENRKVVIDSKISLADYSKFINAATEEEKSVAKKNHINSIKNHIRSLSATEYRSLFGANSLDLIIMFMSVEGAYVLACDDNVVKDAMKEKIAIVGPTTLVAILQIINRAWTNKKQSEDTLKIINQATSIYDAAVLISECFDEFRVLYDKSNEKIIQGMKRSQNLVNKVEKMRKIGGLEPKRLVPKNLRKISDNES